jgi:uncharacterized membrane protein
MEKGKLFLDIIFILLLYLIAFFVDFSAVVLLTLILTLILALKIIVKVISKILNIFTISVFFETRTLLGVSILYFLFVLFMNKFYNLYSTSQLTLGVLIISLSSLILFYLIKIYNINQAKNINKKLEYYRDIPNSLSPAQVSFLYNRKTELKKDIVANILSMAAKKSIELQFDNNRLLGVKDLNNTTNLSNDEMYLYNTFIRRHDQFDQARFIEIVENEINDRKLYKEIKINVTRIMQKIIARIRIPMFFMFFFTIFLVTKEVNSYVILAMLIITISLMLINYVLIPFLAIAGSSPFKEKEVSYVFHLYTKEGSKEMKKWMSLKRFIQTFTNLRNRELNTIPLWEQYLSYAIVFNVNTNYKQINIKDTNQFYSDDVIGQINNSLKNVIK